MAKEKEPKVELERIYTVPLRRKFLNTPRYKRVPKAIKALKEFLARHMKVSERDTEKIKLDKYLNEKMWARGIRKPLGRIKVKARKYDNGNVIVELVEVPASVKFRIIREKRLGEKPVEEKKKEEKKVEKPEETAEEKKEKEEKKEAVKSAVVEAGLEQQKKAAREIKHQVQTQHQIKKPLARKALQK